MAKLADKKGIDFVINVGGKGYTKIWTNTIFIDNVYFNGVDHEYDSRFEVDFIGR
jgi:hypothetical protein